jgi:serine/threonine protein kinase
MPADLDSESTAPAGVAITDEISADDLAYDETVDVHGATVDVHGETVALPESFEHRRAVASARERLFGIRSKLHIGRYRVDEHLGAGGMGEVYLGHDEELDRKVAIKRVLPGIADARAQERLRREARALAKLSHANVVQVYEVGEHEGRTFLAMEYVEGETLGGWLRAEQRSWNEVLDLFLDAGRGLAAAHRAGVVHRDFKADNVLLGHDGVRVADFGLALAGEGPQMEAGELPQGEARLSTVGAVVGTFRYMPLEQLRGKEVDARSDQFSFCVALYEALWHRPPFESRTYAERIRELEHKHAKRPPGRRVPHEIWRVLRRGLASSPQARWPSMTELVDALELARKVARRRWYLSLALVIVVCLSALIWIRDPSVVEPSPRPEPDDCTTVGTEIDDVWNDERRAALETAFAGTIGFMADGPMRLGNELDAWASVWRAEREQNCRAPQALREEFYSKKWGTLCLRRRQQEVELLLEELLAHPDTRTLARAVAEGVALTDPARCVDTHALLDLERPSPTDNKPVEMRRNQMQRARTLRVLGHTEAARQESEAYDIAWAGYGYRPLTAEIRAEHAFAELDAGATERGEALLLEAVDLAEIHHHDRLAAELWTTLANRALTEARDAKEGARLLRRATVAWQTVASNQRDRAWLSIVIGRLAVLERAGVIEAETNLRKALESLDERDPERPEIHATLAELVAASQPDEAIERCEDAVASATKLWGQDHPETAVYVYNLGLALRAVGERDRAREHLARAVAIWTELREHPRRLVLAQAALVELG